VTRGWDSLCRHGSGHELASARDLCLSGSNESVPRAVEEVARCQQGNNTIANGTAPGVRSAHGHVPGVRSRES
jgi:hypothetical protein